MSEEYIHGFLYLGQSLQFCSSLYKSFCNLLRQSEADKEVSHLCSSKNFMVFAQFYILFVCRSHVVQVCLKLVMQTKMILNSYPLASISEGLRLQICATMRSPFFVCFIVLGTSGLDQVLALWVQPLLPYFQLLLGLSGTWFIIFLGHRPMSLYFLPLQNFLWFSL